MGEPVVNVPPLYSYFSTVEVGFNGCNVGNSKFILRCQRCQSNVSSSAVADHNAWHTWLISSLPGHPVEPVKPLGTENEEPEDR